MGTALNLPSVLKLAHRELGNRIGPGDWAVDATVGNGHDTLFLAAHVGPDGHVIGFDIQSQALENTWQLLRQQENDGVRLQDRVTLLHQGHETMDEGIQMVLRQQGKHLSTAAPFPLLKAVMFNLGYLPGGDKARITLPQTTLAAVGSALQWLVPGGILSITAYPGHPGGDMEAAEVRRLLSHLSRKEYQVMEYAPVNTKVVSPFLLLALKQG